MGDIPQQDFDSLLYKYKKHFTKMLADVGIKSLKLQKQDRRDLSLNRDQIPKTTKTRL